MTARMGGWKRMRGAAPLNQDHWTSFPSLAASSLDTASYPPAQTQTSGRAFTVGGRDRPSLCAKWSCKCSFLCLLMSCSSCLVSHYSSVNATGQIHIWMSSVRPPAPLWRRATTWAKFERSSSLTRLLGPKQIDSCLRRCYTAYCGLFFF